MITPAVGDPALSAVLRRDPARRRGGTLVPAMRVGPRPVRAGPAAARVRLAVGRPAHARARLPADPRQFTELTGHTLRRPGVATARVVTTVASVLLLLGVLALAVTGAWLTAYGLPSLNL